MNSLNRALVMSAVGLTLCAGSVVAQDGHDSDRDRREER
jgi:hypothetical protein